MSWRSHSPSDGISLPLASLLGSRQQSVLVCCLAEAEQDRSALTTADGHDGSHPASPSLILLPVYRHWHTRHIHSCHGCGRHDDKWTHHIVILMLKHMAMVHVATREAVEGGGNRDQFTWVDTYRVFPALFVQIKSPILLEANSSRCSSCLRIKALCIVVVSSHCLKSDKMDMERMGIFRQVQNIPYLG